MVYGYVLIGYGKTCGHGNYHLEEVFIILTVPGIMPCGTTWRSTKDRLSDRARGFVGLSPFCVFHRKKEAEQSKKV